jgi:hypothetical protein
VLLLRHCAACCVAAAAAHHQSRKQKKEKFVELLQVQAKQQPEARVTEGISVRKVFTGNKPFCAAVKEAVGKRVVAMNFGVVPSDDRDPVFRSDRLKFHVVDCMGLLHDTLIHLPPMHAHTMLAQQLGVAAADTGGEVPSLYGFGTCVCVHAATVCSRRHCAPY